MNGDTPDEQPPVPEVDPEKLQESHSRYGEYLKKVGLPFEPEEFEEEAEAEADARPTPEPGDHPQGEPPQP